MEFPGRILPHGGLIARGDVVNDDRFSCNFTGEKIEISLPREKAHAYVTLEQAVAIADAIRWLARDTGKVYPSIQMYSGRYFDFLDVENNEIEIEDVAHALANNCRFGGHCDPFYSIAEHSVRASYVTSPEHAYAALMHDSSEAVLQDMPTPIKRILRDYQLLEERVERFMGLRFGYEVPLHAEVKRADVIMLATEKRDLKPNSDHWAMLDGVPTLPEKIEPWSPMEARERFLARYEELAALKAAA